MNNRADKQGIFGSKLAAAHAVDTQEITQSLELAIAQIDMALKEADTSVIELIGAMTSMTSQLNRIEAKTDKLRQFPELDGTILEIEKNCKQAEFDMQQAVVAFQFYDRLSQRFLHVHENLAAVAEVIKAPDQQHAALWHNLHKKVRSVYSLEQEQRLYQNSLAGSSVGNTNKQANANMQSTSDDIELF